MLGVDARYEKADFNYSFAGATLPTGEFQPAFSSTDEVTSDQAGGFASVGSVGTTLAERTWGHVDARNPRRRKTVARASAAVGQSPSRRPWCRAPQSRLLEIFPNPIT